MLQVASRAIVARDSEVKLRDYLDIAFTAGGGDLAERGRT
jgi:hypothetical protein